MHAQTPRRLMPLTRSKLSAGSSAASVSGSMMPALLNAMSSRPNVVDRAVDQRGDLVLVGDVARHAERVVAGGVSSSVGRRAAPLVDVGETTAAPAAAKARAVSSPMPAAAPVTRATWPLKS